MPIYILIAALRVGIDAAPGTTAQAGHLAHAEGPRAAQLVGIPTEKIVAVAKVVIVDNVVDHPAPAEQFADRDAAAPGLAVPQVEQCLDKVASDKALWVTPQAV